MNPRRRGMGVRFVNAALRQRHEVKLFLMSAGVEVEGITPEKYNNQLESAACPVSTMVDCVNMVEWADKVVTF
jgi:sulfur relay (sulfurtransferase) complex TusBCD TusD component (DsrE family)